MQKVSWRFKLVDALYIAMMTLPLLFAVILKVMTKAPSEGISITGAQVYFSIKID